MVTKTSIARRHNVTGVPRLSIGTTKNDRGYILRRYLICAEDNDGTKVHKSFYFGVNREQVDAFYDACSALKDCGEKSVVKLPF